MAGSVEVKLSGYCDGSGNSPKGSSAACVLFSGKKVVAERSVVLPLCSNNIAEYEGVILTLRTAIELGASELIIHSDSQLIVYQTLGEWRVKDSALAEKRRLAWKLGKQLDDLVITWVRREENHRADALCRVALKSFTAGEQTIGEIRTH